MNNVYVLCLNIYIFKCLGKYYFMQKNILKYILFICFLLFSFSPKLEEVGNIDSLNSILNSSYNDSIKIKTVKLEKKIRDF